MAHSTSTLSRVAVATAGWLLAFLLAAYLLNYHGQVTASDEMSMLVVAKNLLKQHSFEASAQIWEFQIGSPAPPDNFGRDGNVYSKKGPG